MRLPAPLAGTGEAGACGTTTLVQKMPNTAKDRAFMSVDTLPVLLMKVSE